MGKKDRMLRHITNNVDWLMTTSNAVQVIPYNELSTSVFNKAKQYFASGAQASDVVCLISTSILEPGKSGILFTTDYVYSKAWGGIFTGTCKNRLSSFSSAKFDVINEFDTERMKELMSDLNDIAIEEKQINNTIQTIEDAGKIVGAAMLGVSALADIFSAIGDALVSQNNENIAGEIAQLENSNDPQVVSAMNIYKEFIPLINEFTDIAVENEDSDDIDEETMIKYIQSLNAILLALYYQAADNIDISPDDMEEYTRFSEWTYFWALMFYDGDKFRNQYSIEMLQDMPEFWRTIAEIVDSFLDAEEWERTFSDILYHFGETITNNTAEVLELMSDSEWDEEFADAMAKIVESNNRAVHSLKNVLDSVTDYFNLILANDDEE